MFNTSKKENYKNHKNRKYSILLLALLFIGVATYGTYAYFTDSKDVAGNITLTKGSVKLSEVNHAWTYQGNNEGNSTLDDKNPKYNPAFTIGQTGETFTNVLPGDVFNKEVTVTYTGSNEATGSITNLPESDNYKIDILLNDEKIENLSSFNLKLNDKIKISLNTSVAYSTKEDYSSGTTNRQNNDVDNLLALTGNIQINASQKLNSKN